MNWTFNDLARLCKGRLINKKSKSPVITDLIIDSRKVVLSEGSVFIAIVGERHNAHDFVHQLYKLGIRQFILSQEVELPDDAGIILVDNSLQALQQIAQAKRESFSKEVLAITGSNGKTIIKEWLYQLMEGQRNVYRSPKSYNSQVGVPLSIWGLRPEHELAIIEAGISKVGEMEKLQKIIQADWGIFTNIGSAHAEGFSGLEEKIAEKAKLFAEAKHLIYCKDHELIDMYCKQNFSEHQLFSWSTTDKNAHLLITRQEITGDSCVLVCKLKNRKIGQFKVPFADTASLENISHLIAFYWLYLGQFDGLQAKLARLQHINMRLTIKQGIHHSRLIDDSYNNDLAGLKIALEFLTQQNKLNEKVLILSDILQSDLSEEKLYAEVAKTVNSFPLTEIYLIGNTIIRYARLFAAASKTFSTTASFLAEFDSNSIQSKTVLIKGARIFGFEEIVKRLEQKIHGTVLEINLDALTHNLNFYKSRLKKGSKLMVMVKAFAYGTGMKDVAELLQFHKVDYLGVAYADEGVELRKSGIQLPIMVMNASEESFEAMLQYGLEPVMYSTAILKDFISFLEQRNARAAIHIEYNSGMNRLGFHDSELGEITAIIKKHDIDVASIFTHLSGADESVHDEFSHQQVKVFLAFYDQLSSELKTKPIRHVLNSPGILRFPDYHFDMVRLGIGLYGIEANQEEQHELLPISSLKTVISQIHHIKKGESVGYSRKGIAEKDMTIATIAIGYADGFSRAFSNGKASVLIKGQLAKVFGNVCMDMCMVDITGIPAQVGDTVLIFGPGLPVSDLAAAIDTIPYEILTNVSERVKRVYYTE